MIISRRMSGEEYIIFMEEKCIYNFGKKLEGNLSLGRPDRRFEHNFKNY
jgi:hypothetical protein